MLNTPLNAFPMLSDNSQVPKLVWFLLLFPLAQLLEKTILALEPEKHLFEWICCFGGAIAGQIVFKADTWYRVGGGILVGYMAGLYWGVDVAHQCHFTEENAGRFLAAGCSDMMARILDYIIRHPRESADFLLDKGVKLLANLGGEFVGKGLLLLKEFFKKLP